jgi:endonuclease YncB( thermonuclease family)
MPRLFPRQSRKPTFSHQIAVWAAPVGLLLLFLAYTAIHGRDADKTAVTVALPLPIFVVDGDTVQSGGFTYRLVGFDTPEPGYLARCEKRTDIGHRCNAAARSACR